MNPLNPFIAIDYDGEDGFPKFSYSSWHQL